MNNEFTLGENIGFNAKSLKLENLMESGVVDPASVTKNSLRNALSVASTVLTTSIVVTLPKVEKPERSALYG